MDAVGDRLLMHGFGGEVAIATTEQNLRQRHALPRRPQAGALQARAHIGTDASWRVGYEFLFHVRPHLIGAFILYRVRRRS